MGFFSEIISSGVKLALTPIAVVVDVGKIVTGNTPDTTKDLVESSMIDLGTGLNDLGEGDL